MKDMILINVPIEPLPERYSIQWDTWFKKEFEQSFACVHTIYGDRSTRKIEVGSFLDVFDTNQYKASQLHQIIQLIRKDTSKKYILFFHDLWFPGLESLAYIRDGAGVDIKITGCLHAGSYDPFDFLTRKGMHIWAESLENSWFSIVDTIFVATRFHAELLLRERNLNPDKLVVSGFPLYDDFTFTQPKENIVVFPHRLDVEKQPHVFDYITKECSRNSWRFIKTKDVCESKDQYYSLLAKSKIAVSFALQETWGIAMQEAVYFLNVPICPASLSYPELYPHEFLYDPDNLQEAIRLIKRHMLLWEFQEQTIVNNLQETKKNLLANNATAISQITHKLITNYVK
jgi:hypothetical protein